MQLHYNKILFFHSNFLNHKGFEYFFYSQIEIFIDYPDIRWTIEQDKTTSRYKSVSFFCFSATVWNYAIIKNINRLLPVDSEF